MQFVESDASSGLLLLSARFHIFSMAQSTGGRILGRDIGPDGALVGQVKVTLVNEATGVGREGVTEQRKR